MKIKVTNFIRIIIKILKYYNYLTNVIGFTFKNKLFWLRNKKAND